MNNETAGYSKKTLKDKIGIKPHMSVAVIAAPANFSLSEVSYADTVSRDLDVILLFVTSKKDLLKESKRCRDYIKKTGALWIAWPKKTSKIVTDIDGNIVREIGLLTGLVDVKVIAIDLNWSGLKFVYRVTDR